MCRCHGLPQACMLQFPLPSKILTILPTAIMQSCSTCLLPCVKLDWLVCICHLRVCHASGIFTCMQRLSPHATEQKGKQVSSFASQTPVHLPKCQASSTLHPEGSAVRPVGGLSSGIKGTATPDVSQLSAFQLDQACTQDRKDQCCVSTYQQILGQRAAAFDDLPLAGLVDWHKEHRLGHLPGAQTVVGLLLTGPFCCPDVHPFSP